ncbi:MAG: hypothetical protein H6633_16690 [Anaerolineales bacterium]|nr:hypothetical protein [Anaerolineales bacterium]
MSNPAAVVTVTLQDSNGMQTQRRYEARVAAVTDAQAIALADDLQATTQLQVVDLQISRRVAGFTATAAEANSAVAETASVRAQLATGAFYSLTMPALKAAVKSGSNVVGTNADLQTFLGHFDDGGGVAGTAGNFYVSDGEELAETFIEGGQVSGKVNR